MAEHGAMDVDTATGVEYEDHLRTYRSFLRFFRWLVVGVVILLIFLAWYSY